MSSGTGAAPSVPAAGTLEERVKRLELKANWPELVLPFPACGTETDSGMGGTVTSVGLSMPSEFNVGGSPVTTSGTLAVTWSDTDLPALAALATTGLAARTGAGTWATRTLTQPAAGITVSNGDGVSGNPTLALANDLAAVEGLSGTGLAAHTAANTWTERTIVAGSSKITLSNGNGVSGNPAIDVDETVLNVGNMTGTLGLTHGGTGGATAVAGFNNLSPLTSRGDLLTRDTTNNVRIVAGSSATFLQMNTLDPAWVTISSDATIAAGGALTLASTGVTAAAYGDASHVGQFTVDAKGRLTAAAHTSISIDHGSQTTGLSDDDHTQYFLLAGRSGGQVAIGGTASGNDLTLKSNTSSDGDIVLSDANVIALRCGGASSVVPVLIGDHLTTITGIDRLMQVACANVAFDSAADALVGFQLGGRTAASTLWTVSANVNGALGGGGQLLTFDPEMRSSGSRTKFGGWSIVMVAPLVSLASATTITGAASDTFFRGLDFEPSWDASGGTSTTWPASTAVYDLPTLTAAGDTLTDRRGLHYLDKTGSGAQTNSYAVDVAEQTVGTHAAALRSAITAGTNKYFLEDTGGAQSKLTGKITTYNNIATVKDGVGYEVATIDATAQGADIASATLYAAPASGLYRISSYIQVTRAGTTSTMPAVRIGWTDPDASAAFTNQQMSATNTGNTTTTYAQAVWVINAKTGTNITYNTNGWASTGGTSMQYALHMRVEQMG